MKNPKKIIFQFLKWTGISILTILFLMYIVPILFPGTISQQVKVFANNHLAGKLDYKKTHLSFFKHFPSLTVSVDDFILNPNSAIEKKEYFSILISNCVAVEKNKR